MPKVGTENKISKIFQLLFGGGQDDFLWQKQYYFLEFQLSYLNEAEGTGANFWPYL